MKSILLRFSAAVVLFLGCLGANSPSRPGGVAGAAPGVSVSEVPHVPNAPALVLVPNTLQLQDNQANSVADVPAVDVQAPAPPRATPQQPLPPPDSLGERLLDGVGAFGWYWVCFLFFIYGGVYFILNTPRRRWRIREHIRRVGVSRRMEPLLRARRMASWVVLGSLIGVSIGFVLAISSFLVGVGAFAVIGFPLIYIGVMAFMISGAVWGLKLYQAATVAQYEAEDARPAPPDR